MRERRCEDLCDSFGKVYVSMNLFYEKEEILWERELV